MEKLAHPSHSLDGASSLGDDHPAGSVGMKVRIPGCEATDPAKVSNQCMYVGEKQRRILRLSEDITVESLCLPVHERAAL
eukprot:6070-Eustigmatos_ZCMA.PRE.1